MASIVDRFVIQMQLYGASQVSNQLLNIANAANGVQGITVNAAKLSSGLKVFAGLAVLDTLKNVGKQAFETSLEFEGLRKQLEVLFDTAQGGDEAFEWAKRFAQETPFDLEEVVKGMISLSVRGIQPTTRNMRVLGATAKLFGVDFAFAAKALAQGGNNNFASLIRTFGITRADLPKNIFNQQGEIINFNKAIEAIIKLLETKFPDAMSKLENQTSTHISNMTDAWKNFLDTVFGDEGLSAVSFMADNIKNLINLFERTALVLDATFNAVFAVMGQIGIILNSQVFFWAKIVGLGKWVETHMLTPSRKFRDDNLNSGLKNADRYWRSMQDQTGEPPGMRAALNKKGGAGDFGTGGGGAKLLKEAIGGGELARRGILPSEMPGLAARRKSNTVHVKLETSEGSDFRIALEHIIQKAVEGMLRHGAFEPAGA